MKTRNHLAIGLFALAVSFSACSDKDEPLNSNPGDNNTNQPELTEKNEMLEHSATLMNTVIKDFLGVSPKNLWTDSYPYVAPENASESDLYWKNVTTVWPASAAYAGFVALRTASVGTEYEEEFKKYDDEFFNAFSEYEDDSNGTAAYNAFPAKGEWMGRYFDDNEWVGLDMVDMYNLTKEQRYLDKAVMVWNYVNKLGWNPACGGGILWREKGDGGPTTSTNTCSTGPAAVLSAKLYEVTQDQKYLDVAKKLYQYCLDSLQTGNLFVDHIYQETVDGKVVTKRKDDWIFPYNAGTPMQTACLLYKITNDNTYLKKAQAIARSAFNRFYSQYYSPQLDDDFKIPNGDDFSTHAILIRAYLELYSIDGNATYLKNITKSMAHAWLACRQPNGLINHVDMRGEKQQSSWVILQEGYFVEIYARLAKLFSEGKLPAYKRS